jgi:hypothetical protein
MLSSESPAPSEQPLRFFDKIVHVATRLRIESRAI